MLFLSPDTVPGRVANIMKHELGLTSEQRDKLEAIFRARTPQIDAVREKIIPEMDAILEDIRKEVDAILTPDQAKAWDTRFHELRDRWRPKSPQAK